MPASVGQCDLKMKWVCRVCTCQNEAGALACTACGALAPHPPGSPTSEAALGTALTQGGNGNNLPAPGDRATGEDSQAKVEPGGGAPSEGPPRLAPSLGSGNGNGCRPRWQSQGLGIRRSFRGSGRGGRRTGLAASQRPSVREEQEEEVEGADEAIARQTQIVVAAAAAVQPVFSEEDLASMASRTSKRARQACRAAILKRQRGEQLQSDLQAQDARTAVAAAIGPEHTERVRQARMHCIEMTRQRAEAAAAESVAAATAEVANAEDDEGEQQAMWEYFQCRVRTEERALRIIQEARASWGEAAGATAEDRVAPAHAMVPCADGYRPSWT